MKVVDLNILKNGNRMIPKGMVRFFCANSYCDGKTESTYSSWKMVVEWILTTVRMIFSFWEYYLNNKFSCRRIAMHSEYFTRSYLIMQTIAITETHANRGLNGKIPSVCI